MATDTAAGAPDGHKAADHNDESGIESAATPAKVESFPNTNEFEADGGRDAISSDGGDIEGNYDLDSSEDLQLGKLRSMNKTALQFTLLEIAEKIKECKFAKQTTGKSVLRQIDEQVKAMPEGDAKTDASARARILLGTFNEYVNGFNGLTEDNSLFLKLSQIFKAEYDSRVTFPNQIVELEATTLSIKCVLEEKERGQKKVARMKECVQNMLDCVQYSEKKREKVKRNFAAEDAMIMSWQASSMKPHKRQRKQHT